MIWPLVGMAGAMVGAGMWVLAMAARRPSLAELLTTPPPQPSPQSWGQRYGHAGGLLLGTLGLPSAAMRRHLAAAETEVAGYLAEKAIAATWGILTPVVLGVVLAATDTSVPITSAMVVALGCVVSCWMAPDVAVRRQAGARRRELAAITSLVADLVVINLAGGAGVNQAMARACEQGQGWAASRLRLAVRTAALNRHPIWQPLGELAERTGATELGELAASLRLAGADGATIRASLAAKAASLRIRESSAAEGRATATTEQMSLPVLGLVIGFLLMIGYPALTHIQAGF